MYCCLHLTKLSAAVKKGALACNWQQNEATRKMTLLEILFIHKYIAVCTVKDFLLTFSSSILPEDEGKADAVRFVGVLLAVGGQRSGRRGRQDDRTGQGKQGRQAGRQAGWPQHLLSSLKRLYVYGYPKSPSSCLLVSRTLSLVCVRVFLSCGQSQRTAWREPSDWRSSCVSSPSLLPSLTIHPYYIVPVFFFPIWYKLLRPVGRLDLFCGKAMKSSTKKRSKLTCNSSCFPSKKCFLLRLCNFLIFASLPFSLSFVSELSRCHQRHWGLAGTSTLRQASSSFTGSRREGGGG